MMEWEVVVTLGIVLAILVILIRDWAPADLTFLAASGIFASLGIITPEEAFSGFSNSGMLTVAALFVVAAGMRETGVLDRIGFYVLGKARTETSALLRLSGVVLPMSAFLNNTPIVAMFMPVVMDWCRRVQISPSKLLIPLSYLSILGGTLTLIGTSTNLVVQGLIIEEARPDLFPLSLFEIAWVGLPYAVTGVVFMALFGTRLLPARKELLEQLGESRREYLVEMRVEPTCRLIGKTIEAAGLRHLPGLFLVEIQRGEETLAPVGPNDVLAASDRLLFTGVVSGIIELERIAGLVPDTDPSYDASPSGQRQRRWCEAVVSATSPLVGNTIREADFRSTYGAAVLAVHRDGKRVVGKIGDIRLRPGDTLLMQVGRNFLKRHRHDPAFYLVSDVDSWRPVRTDRAWLATILFFVLIVVMSAGFVNGLVIAALVALAMIGTGCISASDARASIEWQVLIAIAAAFGVGKAIDQSGTAQFVAESLVESTRSYGPFAALLIIFLLTSVVTEVITNNAAAVLMFPFCLKTAELYGVDARPFVIALMMAASASFLTPIGYQTNMMVYGPGGYRFADFIRIGLPLSIVTTIVAMIVIPWAWPLDPVAPLVPTTPPAPVEAQP